MSDTWFEDRTYRHTDWTPGRLLDLKRRRGLTVSLVVPARNEEATVGGIVSRVREALVERVPLLDEVVVMDSDSTDATGRAAAAAGAAVHRVADVRPDLGHRSGKGEALWKSQFVTSGDVLAFLDADLVEWDTHFVSGLLGPLLTEPGVHLVKGFYDRLLDLPGGGRAGPGGGRVTELVARPTLALRWPALSGVVQPLAGEWAIRRDLFGRLSVPTGYGVELAVLIDTHLRCGADAVAQVDLGRRAHRHQPLSALGAMAAELLAIADRRSGIEHGDSVAFPRFDTSGGRTRPRTGTVSTVERPPAAGVGPERPRVLGGAVGRC